MLRIIGGEAKGRKLKGPKGLDFRPATSQVKEFIFSIIGSRIENAVVLDLFSGSGSLGIEALSRGAEYAVMIESSFRHVQIIEQNLRTCRFEEFARIMRGDVFKVLKVLGRNRSDFDIILADPPFKLMLRGRIAESIEANSILRKGGLMLIEHQIADTDGRIQNISLIRQKKFGQSMVSIYE